MRYVYLLLVSLLALAVAAVVAGAAWGRGACPPVGGSVAVAYEWAQDSRTDGAQWHLMEVHGGARVRQLGTWLVADQQYYPYTGSRQWSETAAPVPPFAPPLPAAAVRAAMPAPPAKPAEDVTDFGVDLRGWKSDPRVSRAAGADGLPDDAAHLRLTVIGSEAECKQVMSDLQSDPALKSLLPRVVVREFRPDHWLIRDLGFAPGSPAIYLQTPDGKVLHRQASYRGAADLAAALRKADPNYRPEKDPDLTRPSLPLPQLPDVPWQYLLLGAVVLFVLISRRKE